jgi:hypothetical protein
VPQPEPEKDWSKSPFYSKTLKELNFDYGPDQFGFYGATLTGFGIVARAGWRSWNIKMASRAMEKGLNDGSLDFHIHHSGKTNEQQITRAINTRHFAVGRAVALAGLLMGTVTAFVQFKNRNCNSN